MSNGKLGLFDRFASSVDKFTSRATFFTFCVLLVIIWAPSFFIIGNLDTWQLIINTATTIITFLLVALLQNTQKRGMDAMHEKLNDIAKVLVHNTSANRENLSKAIGLEERQGTKK
jgi:low affinity Fe/Cu permease